MVIAIAESRRNGASLPVTTLVDQFYSEVEKIGRKRWDTSQAPPKVNLTSR
jgi:3-hydroxyisobutyrate dehydrogenase